MKMKKWILILTVISMIMSLSNAMAAMSATVTERRISTRSGPGTGYTEPGSFLSSGAQVIAHTKVYDSTNEMFWVQVEFVSGGERYRAYTGDWRLDVDLDFIPYEYDQIAQVQLVSHTYGYAGPGYHYHFYNDIVIYSGYGCSLIEVENDFALIDTYYSSQGHTRVWVPLGCIVQGSAYEGWDTFPADDQGAVLLPGDGFDDDYPIGRTCVVWVESGNARYGAGTQYDFARYVHKGDVLTILDRRIGNTGKDWYKVRISGTVCWLSSGLVTVDGYSEGTINGVPIISEEDNGYKQYLVGKWLHVNSQSAHVRAKADTVSQTVEYVLHGEYYEILEVCVGSTGKDWYRIKVDGVYGWISSGLVTVIE